MSDSSRYFQGLATGAVLGGVIGAGLALFLSPNSGVQNRKIVINKFNSAVDYLSDVSEDVADAVSEIFGEVSAATINLYEDGRKMFQKQMKSFQNNWGDIDKDKYFDMIDSISEVLERNKSYAAEDIALINQYWKKNWRKIEAAKDRTVSKVAKVMTK